jgi:hypothetical protein
MVTRHITDFAGQFSAETLNINVVVPFARFYPKVSQNARRLALSPQHSCVRETILYGEHRFD